jgi:hypothetical protein
MTAELVAEAREHRAELLATLMEYVATTEFSDALKAADATLEATERAAIIGEGDQGNARASVPHRLPPSWSDARIEPTLGAACHFCQRGRWWCEAVNPSGWRCMTCHPPGYLAAGQPREVNT